MPAAQGILPKVRLQVDRVGALAAAFGVDGRRAAGRMFARSHACRAKRQTGGKAVGFTLLFSAMMVLGVLFLVVGFVALGCFVAATVVSIAFFLRRKRRAAEGKKLGWLVAIPIALYAVSIPVLIFLAVIFLPGGFTSDYGSCVSAIASHDEDGLQDALASSKGSLASSGENSYEGLVWEALSYNDAVCLRAVLEHAEEQGRPVDLNRPIADPDNADEEECALLIAVQSPVVSCEVLRVLLEFGADPSCSSASGSGTTPLHWVARGLWSPDSSNAHVRVDYTVEVAALLIDTGADAEALDAQGFAPRDYFEQYLGDLVENGEITEEDMDAALNRVPL